MAKTSLQLGMELARLSGSHTWQQYREMIAPDARVGFYHHADSLYFTLTEPRGQFRGIVKYAESIEGIIELAHLALQEQEGIEVL